MVSSHRLGYTSSRVRPYTPPYGSWFKTDRRLAPTTDPSDSLVLQEVFGSIDRLVRRAQALASPSSVPQPVLFLLHQRNRDQKPSTPFSGQMEDATRTTYSNIWKQVIGYFFRTEVWEPGTVPPYKLSTAQENAINDIEVFFESQTAPLPLPDKAYPDLDVRCLTLFLSIFDHELSGSPYDSLLLTVIKIGRLFLLLQSYDESNSEDPKSPSLYSVVRTKVFRYFTVVSAESQPSPIDFIFEARAYGIAIASGTASSADIQWEGQKVMYGKVSFTMPQFIQFVQNLTSELRRTMLSLLFIEDGSDLPSVPLTGLQDDLTDFRPEYSFLVDPRNICFTSCTGPDWLVQRITRQKSLCTAWFNGETIQPRVLEEYADLVDRFRARSKQNVKIIHRYLPDEIGADLVRYLWLVLPFWENALGIAGRGSIRSSFLFSKELVRKEDVVRGQTGSASEGLWDSDRMRRLLEAASLRLLGVKLNIHDYRHIVIAISRQFIPRSELPCPTRSRSARLASTGIVGSRSLGHRIRGVFRRAVREAPGRRLPPAYTRPFAGLTCRLCSGICSNNPKAGSGGPGSGNPGRRTSPKPDFIYRRHGEREEHNLLTSGVLFGGQHDDRGGSSGGSPRRPPGRCTKLGITSWIYSYEGMQHAQVVLVTPESAGTKTFHDSGRTSKKIGRTTIEFGVPLLLLTATLAVPDIPAFIQSTGIDLRRTTIFRSSTVRANLRYSVTWVDQTDGEVPEAVRQIPSSIHLLFNTADPDLLLLAATIHKAVGKLLRCPSITPELGQRGEIRYRTEVGRTRRMYCFHERARGRTGHRGRTIRVPYRDPRLLRDFVQESGRAGRDGQRAESHIVRALLVLVRAGLASIIGREDIWDYMDGTGGCRRVSLDRVMDGDCHGGDAARTRKHVTSAVRKRRRS
ncbi:Bloom syndrome protein-like protein [Apiospora saccharicola]